jgi:cytochrome c oxidase assembly protein subunit 15
LNTPTGIYWRNTLSPRESGNYPHRFYILLNCIALICTLIIILLSAHIRMGESGLGCQPWPACYTQSVFLDTTQGLEIPEGEFQSFRALHRVFASVLGIIVLIVAIMAVWYRRQISPILPVLMLSVVLFLSVLGVSTPTRTFPAVTLGNVLGGILLSALIWRHLLSLLKKPVSLVPGLSLKVLSALIMLQLVTGAWASANFTASACPALLQCDFIANLPAHFNDSFKLMRQLTLSQNQELVFTPSMEVIQFVHRLVAIALLAAITVAFVQIRNNHRPLVGSIAWVAGLFAMEAALGVFNVLWEMPLLTNTLHNLLAVLLLLATISLLHNASATDEQQTRVTNPQQTG